MSTRRARRLTPASRYKYSWTKSYNVDANIAGEIIRRVQTAQAVVAAARVPGSPLHELFDWNDTAAAESFRLVQARVMINSLRVEIIDAQRKPTRIFAFVKDAENLDHYVPTFEADSAAMSRAELQ